MHLAAELAERKPPAPRNPLEQQDPDILAAYIQLGVAKEQAAALRNIVTNEAISAAARSERISAASSQEVTRIAKGLAPATDQRVQDLRFQIDGLVASLPQGYGLRTALRDARLEIDKRYADFQRNAPKF